MVLRHRGLVCSDDASMEWNACILGTSRYMRYIKGWHAMLIYQWNKMMTMIKAWYAVRMYQWNVMECIGGGSFAGEKTQRTYRT